MPLRTGTAAGRPVPSGVVTLRLKHLFRLSRDVGRFATVNRVWWFVPMLVTLGLIAVAVATTQAVVPVAVYTLF